MSKTEVTMTDYDSQQLPNSHGAESSQIPRKNLFCQFSKMAESESLGGETPKKPTKKVRGKKTPETVK